MIFAGRYMKYFKNRIYLNSSVCLNNVKANAVIEYIMKADI